jgi:hypothetical protein
MNEHKLKIVNLELGVEKVFEEKPQPSSKTITKIEELKQSQQIEQQALGRLKQAQHDKIRITEQCFQSLMDAGIQGISIEKLMEKQDNILSLMVSLHNFIKKRGDHWKIRKRQKDGKIYYWLEAH